MKTIEEIEFMAGVEELFDRAFNKMEDGEITLDEVESLFPREVVERLEREEEKTPPD